MKFRVIKGIFKDHVFNGQISNDGQTIWDYDSYGRGYPIKNCRRVL